MKHKYYDVIVKWAEGQPIQYRFIVITDVVGRSKWVDLSDPYCFNKFPNFNDGNVEWRIKPETKVIKYRLALMSYKTEEYYTAVFNTSEHFLIEFMNSANFVKWLSDWIEYEVTDD